MRKRIIRRKRSVLITFFITLTLSICSKDMAKSYILITTIFSI
nr:MAG TPA: hypothetical protein [Caudoviricetes sp.]